MSIGRKTLLPAGNGERGEGRGTLRRKGTRLGTGRTSPLSLLPFCLIATVLGAPTPGESQIPTSVPPPAQAQAALQQAIQQNPGLADLLRQRLQQSGLTADQIRARLQASGYPVNLLDAYLGGTGPGQLSVTPSANELAAVSALGLAPIT